MGIAFKERFTMLEPCRPLNPSPEELASRVVEVLINDGPVDMKLLGPKGRLGNMMPPGGIVRKAAPRQPKSIPSPEEAARAENSFTNGAPTGSEPPTLVPPAVQSLLAQLATAIEALDANGRAATLDYISNKFTKRLAG